METSPSIQRLIYCLLPLGWSKPTRWGPFERPYPIYEQGSAITVHLSFGYQGVAYEDYFESRAKMVTFEIQANNRARLEASQDEFATRPFCEELHLEFRNSKPSGGGLRYFEFRRELRGNGGIRIGDLLRAYGELDREWDALTGLEGYPLVGVMSAGLRENMTKGSVTELRTAMEIPENLKYWSFQQVHIN